MSGAEIRAVFLACSEGLFSRRPHCSIHLPDHPPSLCTPAAPNSKQKRIDAAPVVSVRGTEGHMSRLTGARPTQTVDTSLAQPQGNSRGWFGWRDNAPPLPAGSQGNDVVTRRASQQGKNVLYKYECPHDKIAEENGAGGLRLGAYFTILVEHVRWRTEDARSRSYRPSYLEGTRRGTLTVSMPLGSACCAPRSRYLFTISRYQ